MIKINIFLLFSAVVLLLGYSEPSRSKLGHSLIDSISPTLPSSKKGVGFVGSETLAISGLNISWCYNWVSKCEPKPVNVEFVPMFWVDQKKPQINDVDVEIIKNSNAKAVLGFNEPDAAGITVEQALDLWPKLMATGKRLGSPAPTTDNVFSGSWLDKFMQGIKARGYRVDFIALHWYGGITRPDAVMRLKRHLEAVHDKYGLPIWLTEFGGAYPPWIADEKIPTIEQNVHFIKDVCVMLEHNSFIERYAWWGVSAGNDLYTDPVTGQKVAPKDRLIKFADLAHSRWSLTPAGHAYSKAALTSTLQSESEIKAH